MRVYAGVPPCGGVSILVGCLAQRPHHRSDTQSSHHRHRPRCSAPAWILAPNRIPAARQLGSEGRAREGTKGSQAQALPPLFGNLEAGPETSDHKAFRMDPPLCRATVSKIAAAPIHEDQRLHDVV